MGSSVGAATPLCSGRDEARSAELGVMTGAIAQNTADGAVTLRAAGHATATPASNGDFSASAHGLRGIASLMVLFAHILGGTADHIYARDVVYVGSVQPVWLFLIKGVPLFFLISGYVILPSAMRYSPKGFFLRRFLRLYPIFFICSVAFVILNLMTDYYPKLNDPLSIVSGLLFINLFTGTEQLTPNAWSLSYEVAFYALTCMAVHLALRRRSVVGAVLSGLVCSAFVVAFPIAIYFVGGVCARLLHDRSLVLRKTANRIVEVLALLAFIYYGSRGHYEYEYQDFLNPDVHMLIISMSIYFYCAASPGSLTSIASRNPLVTYVGTVSYSLYLVHPYIYFSLRRLFLAWGGFTNDIVHSMSLFSLAVVSLSLVATHFAHIYFERAPYRWYFRQNIYHGRSKDQDGTRA